MNTKSPWFMLIVAQGTTILGASLVFPFYLIFIREVGASFTQFGLAYGLFTLSSAIVHRWIGTLTDYIGRVPFLVANAWGMALLFLLLPIVTAIWQVYALQILLGIFGAMQKTSEKALLADLTEYRSRGQRIGRYHFWTAISSGLAIIGGGMLIDFFTLDIIFYTGSIILFISGWVMLGIVEPFRLSDTNTKEGTH
ncbi:MFS transporter [Caldalkalibacillus salinus]|uniref:MFS transporter n=1 Tax=Caldalkalibacillus salinus TaxID=2803787 RepID=UPI001F002F06|nr:MFS transporter [Caldalkalibacillus salinus]